MTRINRQAIGIGLLAGLALGAVYTANKQKQFSRDGIPAMLQWNRVRRLAVSMNPEPEASAEWHESWKEYYTGLVRRCEPLIAEEIGRALPQPVEDIAAFSRAEWVDANIRNFEQLFAPLEKLHLAASDPNDIGTLLLSDVNQAVLSTELGVLMGYLARRVLGQYDLSLLGKETLSAGRLYFVEPNIAGVQQELGIDADDFRLWIALHETTHAFEFEAFPWVREYFNTLLESYFNLITDDLTSIRNGMSSVTSLVNRARSNMSSGESWIEMVMSDEQKELFNKLQALMSVIEGYSNYIMNAVGERLLPSYGFIKERFESRAAKRGRAEQLFIRLTGLALKMEQYRRGEEFINAVAAERGIEFANHLWDGPDFVPTMAELGDYASWIARVDGILPSGDHATALLDGSEETQLLA